MTEQDIPDLHDEDAAEFRDPQAPVVRIEMLLPFLSPAGLLDGDANSDPSQRQIAPKDAVPDTLGQRRPRQNTACTSPQAIRRDLARTWRLMLALRIDEALGMIERLELQLDDVPPLSARRLRGATQLLRAAGLAFQDDSLAV